MSRTCDTFGRNRIKHSAHWMVMSKKPSAWCTVLTEMQLQIIRVYFFTVLICGGLLLVADHYKQGFKFRRNPFSNSGAEQCRHIIQKQTHYSISASVCKSI
jgi:hypothetical protein